MGYRSECFNKLMECRCFSYISEGGRKVKVEVTVKSRGCDFGVQRRETVQ